MTDLADFLRARIAERRAIAEAATPGPWHSDGGTVYAKHPTDQVVDYSESADHIATNDPADVIADLDAKLAIVNRHTACGTGNGYCDDGGHGWDDSEGGGCADLADLAQPFAGHPDYKDEWRPTP
ncbi:DUF6221 family protein [Streptomyces rubiginosohelvolus]|uniref:DUF6221 family protein n=1 Tax=Streptomyces rubiginosohelvolus TaxID=67362 RepID=UPI0036AACE31